MQSYDTIRFVICSILMYKNVVCRIVIIAVILNYGFYFCSVLSNSAIDIAIEQTDHDYGIAIEQAIEKPIRIVSLMIDADIQVYQEEIQYLLGFYEGETIDARTLTKAAYYLFKKNKFSKIVFHLVPVNNDEMALTFRLTGIWTLKKLKIHGMLLGKDMYRQYYLMEPGEPFDEHKHHDSLDRIKERFTLDGYFNAKIEDTLSYDHQHKTVDVALAFNCGARFVINQACCIVHNDQISAQEYEHLSAKINAQLTKQLRRKLYTKTLINREAAIIKRLLLRKGFSHIHITLTEQIDYQQSAVQVIMKIDSQKGREFVFFGNHAFSHDQLSLVLVVFGRAASSIPASILAQEIAFAYREKGFWQVSVSTNEEDRRIYFIIHEGPRAIIKEVTCFGQADIIPKKQVDICFAPVLQMNLYNDLMVKKAIGELITYYAHEGFFDARIIIQKLVATNQKGACRLELDVDAGVRFYVQRIIIDQFPDFVSLCPGSQEIAASMPVACTQKLLDEQKAWLESQLTSLGYAHAPVKVELVREGSAVALQWHIDLKKIETRFGKTVIVGNDSLPAPLILRELPYTAQDYFDLQLVRKALENVRAMNIFDAVMISPDAQDDLLDNNERAIVIHVQPSDPFEVRLHAGIGLQQMTKPISLAGLTYKFGGAFMIKNLTNAADLLRLDLDVTRSYRDVVFRYERPWIFDYPIKLLLQGYSTQYRQPGFFIFNQGLYEVRQQGFLAGATRKYAHIDASITAGLEWMFTKIRKEYVCLAPRVIKAFAINPNLINHNTPYFFVEPTIIVDYTDQKINPTRGLFTLCTLKGMLPLKDNSLYLRSLKCLIEQSFFVPLRYFVFAFRARLGYIVGAPLEELQLIERFYLGGAHSLRSYEPDTALPLGSFTDLGECCHCVPQGAKGMMNVTGEIRFPLFGALQGVIFQDLGMLSDNAESTVQGGTLLAATGIGLRYNTPIGPLSFDIGWKWSRHGCFDRSYAWYLTLGNVF